MRRHAEKRRRCQYPFHAPLPDAPVFLVTATMPIGSGCATRDVRSSEQRAAELFGGKRLRERFALEGKTDELNQDEDASS